MADIPFVADWESVDARKTSQPPWKHIGSTPGKIKIAPRQHYRVTLRPDTPASDLPAIFAAIPTCNIRTILVKPGLPIGVTELGGALATVTNVRLIHTVRNERNASWYLRLELSIGYRIEIIFEQWTSENVLNMIGCIPKANELFIRAYHCVKPMNLSHIFGIRGLKTITVEHSNFNKLKFGWKGLSSQNFLEKLHVEHGHLTTEFWNEVGKLQRLRELEFSWIEESDRPKNSLNTLKSLKKVEGSCMFEAVPGLYHTLSQSPNLTNFKIDQSRFGDDSAAGMGAMVKVTKCHIWNVATTDKAIQNLCQFPKIKSLTLCEDRSQAVGISDVGFQAISNLKTLEHLHLSGFDQVSPAGWKVISQLPKLKRLQLRTDPSFDVLEAIGSLPKLEEISLAISECVTPAGAKLLPTMKKLTALDYHFYTYAPHYIPLVEIGSITSLQRLKIQYAERVSNDQFAEVGRLSELTDFSIDHGKKINDDSFVPLFNCRKLTSLSLQKMPKLTDATLLNLKRFLQLTKLNVRCTSKMTDAGFAALVLCRGLTSLHLENARNLSGSQLVAMVRKLPLEELYVEGSSHIGDDDVEALLSHPTLKRVIIHGKNVSGECTQRIHSPNGPWDMPTFFYYRPFISD